MTCPIRVICCIKNNSAGRSISFLSLSWIITIITVLHISAANGGTIRGAVTIQGEQDHENVIIFIDKVEDNNFPAPKREAVIDQRSLTFIPHVMPILVGTTVNFFNNDRVRHNVFSPSQTNSFNLGTYPMGASKFVRFEKPGLVVLLCHVHTEMSAFVLVLKNPYFAVSDKEGNFTIPNQDAMKAAHVEEYTKLPAGRYLIRTWHEKSAPQMKWITIPADGEVEVEFKLLPGKRGKVYD